MGKYLIKTIKIGDDGKHGDWTVESDWMLVDPENIHTINIFGKKYTDEKVVNTDPKHGKWIWNKRLGEWYCSNCDRIMTPYTVEKSDGEYEMTQPFFCGWCGAKMDLDGGEEE